MEAKSINTSLLVLTKTALDWLHKNLLTLSLDHFRQVHNRALAHLCQP